MTITFKDIYYEPRTGLNTDERCCIKLQFCYWELIIAWCTQSIIGGEKK